MPYFRGFCRFGPYEGQLDPGSIPDLSRSISDSAPETESRPGGGGRGHGGPFTFRASRDAPFAPGYPFLAHGVPCGETFRPGGPGVGVSKKIPSRGRNGPFMGGMCPQLTWWVFYCGCGSGSKKLKSDPGAYFGGSMGRMRVLTILSPPRFRSSMGSVQVSTGIGRNNSAAHLSNSS